MKSDSEATRAWRPTRSSFILLPATGPGNKLDLALYVPGIGGDDDKNIRYVTYLLLDATLGEYDVETKLGRLDFRSASAKPADARPLAQLPALVDGLH